MTLLTVVLLAAFVSLGRWQWQRGADKQQLWEQFDHAPAPALTSQPPNFDTSERFSRVAFPARYEPEHQFLVPSEAGLWCGHVALIVRGSTKTRFDLCRNVRMLFIWLQ